MSELSLLLSLPFHCVFNWSSFVESLLLVDVLPDDDPPDDPSFNPAQMFVPLLAAELLPDPLLLYALGGVLLLPVR